MHYNFWCPNPDTAAKAVSRLFPDDAAQCIALADQVCRNSFCFRGRWEMEKTNMPVTFSDQIAWDYMPKNDPEWIYAFNRHSFFVVLGQAWRSTGEERYAKAFVRLCSDWLERMPLTEQSKLTCWRPIETGIRCEMWLRALMLFENSSTLTPTLLEKMKKSLAGHAVWLLEAHGPFQRLSNWGILQDHGLFLLGLAFENREWADTAVARLDKALATQVFADGSHWEQSPMYHGEVLHCCLNTILAARKSDFVLPDTFLRRVHSMCTALALWIRPDGKLLCQSDSDEIDARNLLSTGAILFDDSELKAYTRETLFPELIWDFGEEAEQLYGSVPCGKIRGSTALPDSGNFMLWDGEGADSGFLHFHCGCLGSGHGHADLLHVDLVSHEETILADSGRYTYVDSPVRKELKRPYAHNIATVDGQDFSVYRSSWSYSSLAEPIKGEYRYTSLADYVSGAHLGYLMLGVFTRRRVLRLGTGLWVLWDEFHTQHADDCHSYDRYFHFGPDGKAVIQENGAVYIGKNCTARLICPDSEIMPKMSRTPLSREYNLLEESDCLRVSTRSTGTTALITVIAVGNTNAPPAVSVHALEVHLAKSQEVLSPQKARAIRILKDSQEWTLIVSHTEIISEVDLLSAGGCEGYGKVLVFGPGAPDGLCLAW